MSYIMTWIPLSTTSFLFSNGKRVFDIQFVQGQSALVTPYIAECQLLLKRLRACSYEAIEAWEWWEIRGLSWTGLINYSFLWKHWMGSGLLVFATCCLCLILWFLISCKAMANFSSSLGMLYVKKNHGSFVFLIEFVKEVIAINISTQPYFPHNLFQDLSLYEERSTSTSLI